MKKTQNSSVVMEAEELELVQIAGERVIFVSLQKAVWKCLWAWVSEK